MPPNIFFFSTFCHRFTAASIFSSSFVLDILDSSLFTAYYPIQQEPGSYEYQDEDYYLKDIQKTMALFRALKIRLSFLVFIHNLTVKAQRSPCQFIILILLSLNLFIPVGYPDTGYHYHNLLLLMTSAIFL
jgi:hypothetical protein